GKARIGKLEARRGREGRRRARVDARLLDAYRAQRVAFAAVHHGQLADLGIGDAHAEADHRRAALLAARFAERDLQRSGAQRAERDAPAQGGGEIDTPGHVAQLDAEAVSLVGEAGD